MSMAGNPLPDLKWYKGDVEITGVTTDKVESADYSRSELEIIANRSDNGLEYRCEAKNEAIGTALVSKIKIGVRFKPSRVDITVDPAVPKAGKKATLTCKCGSSNPTASIVWRRGHTILHGVNEEPVVAGEFGGNLTTNRLEINVTAELDGATYICIATNQDLKQSVHNAETLKVNCKH